MQRGPYAPRFYGQSGMALLQAPAPTAYGGMDGSSVVQLLESIAADFARLEADTKAEDGRPTAWWHLFICLRKVDLVVKRCKKQP